MILRSSLSFLVLKVPRKFIEDVSLVRFSWTLVRVATSGLSVAVVVERAGQSRVEMDAVGLSS